MKYMGKYRIDSTGLKNYDYSQSGFYYVTVCTDKRKCILSDVKETKVFLKPMGKILETEIINTHKIRPDVAVVEYAIMPNHWYAIFQIKRNADNLKTHCDASLQIKSNLSNVVKGIKTSTTTKLRKSGLVGKAWQSRFYEHIIRDEKGMPEMREYISNNAIKLYNPNRKVKVKS